MTARCAFRMADVERALKAARKVGLPVYGIRPDGTVLVGENPEDGPPTVEQADHNAETSRWEDEEA